jgi:NAD(P)-dependent dehydrogenase (short-subunit alcohol dehydrogenase family)
VIGGGARAYALDVNDAVSVTKTFEAIAADFGTIHLLVNNAGIGILGPAESLAVADWDKTISVNLHGPFLRARRRSLPASAEMGPGGHHRVPSGRDRHRRLCRL